MSEKQLGRIESLREEIEAVEENLESKQDKDKADLIQLQAVRKAKQDLKKAGAHIGYSNANRHMEDAERRIQGIKATADL